MFDGSSTGGEAGGALSPLPYPSEHSPGRPICYASQPPIRAPAGTAPLEIEGPAPRAITTAAPAAGQEHHGNGEMKTVGDTTTLTQDKLPAAAATGAGIVGLPGDELVHVVAAAPAAAAAAAASASGASDNGNSSCHRGAPVAVTPNGSQASDVHAMASELVGGAGPPLAAAAAAAAAPSIGPVDSGLADCSLVDSGFADCSLVDGGLVGSDVVDNGSAVAGDGLEGLADGGTVGGGGEEVADGMLLGNMGISVGEGDAAVRDSGTGIGSS